MGVAEVVRGPLDVVAVGGLLGGHGHYAGVVEEDV